VNLSPDAPALDFCLARAGGVAFDGPVLRAAGGATAAGVAYGEGSAYMTTVSDSYDVRAVAAGSTDCSRSIGSFATSLPTLNDDEHTTLVAEGNVDVDSGSPLPFGVHDYPDDVGSTASGIELRFINASSSVDRGDLGTGSLADDTFGEIFRWVDAGSSATKVELDGGVMDDNRYLAMPALTSATLSAHEDGASQDDAIANGVSIADGKDETVFLIGGAAGDSAHPSALLLCDDGVTDTDGKAHCNVVSP
jgi:hypothetical protein